MLNNLEERKEQYRSLPKTNLRILLSLSTPIVRPKSTIMLDSILVHAVARELFSVDMDRWQDDESHIDLPLPLEEVEGTYPVWKASCAYGYSKITEFQDFFTKRTYDEFSPYVTTGIVWPAGVISDKVEQSKPKEFTVELATGPYADSARGGFKSYFEKRELITVQQIAFHAVGNKYEIERLLNEHIISIGKKRSIGFGQIRKIDVLEIEEDWSLVDQEGKPARYLPVIDFQEKTSGRIEAVSPRPAYWSTKNLTLCYAPPSPFPQWEHKELVQHVAEWDEFDEIDELAEWDE